MRYGYARVSSKSQDYEAQVEALKAADCQKIYSEKKSGKNTKDRPEFNRLMGAIRPGDTVVVMRLDRLARSSRDLANIMHELQEKGCGFVSLWETWCDTTNKFGRLLVTIMGGLNQFERTYRRTMRGRHTASQSQGDQVWTPQRP
jgi:DNA invertase Pin-like site-specific DNA recombinase